MYKAYVYNKGEIISIGYGNGKNKEDARLNAEFAFMIKYGINCKFDNIIIEEIDENCVIHL